MVLRFRSTYAIRGRGLRSRVRLARRFVGVCAGWLGSFYTWVVFEAFSLPGRRFFVFLASMGVSRFVARVRTPAAVTASG